MANSVINDMSSLKEEKEENATECEAKLEDVSYLQH